MKKITTGNFGYFQAGKLPLLRLPESSRIKEKCLFILVGEVAGI